MLLQHKFEIRPLGNAIFRINISDGVDIELDDAKEMHAELLDLAKNEKYCILLDASNRFNVSSEARKIVAGKEYSSNRIALAFLARSMANVLVGNFFIKVNKPFSPTKLFSTEESALSWLKTMVESKQTKNA